MGAIVGAEKSQQCHKHFLQYSTIASESPQIRTQGRHTFFLSSATSNLVIPLISTHYPGYFTAACLTKLFPAVSSAFALAFFQAAENACTVLPAVFSLNIKAFVNIFQIFLLEIPTYSIASLRDPWARTSKNKTQCDRISPFAATEVNPSFRQLSVLYMQLPPAFV